MTKERKSNKLKANAAFVLAMLLAFGGLESPITVKAETNVGLATDVSADGEEINGGKELIYDAAKNDTNMPYYVSYINELDMGTVWSNYGLAKAFYFLNYSFTDWPTKMIDGQFKVSFKIDPNYVSVNPDFVSTTAVQQQYEKDNASTTFTNFVRCYDVTYNNKTGVFTADFKLQTDGKDGMLVKTLDAPEARPAKFRFTTPKGAFYVKQSNFKEGESFVMAESRISGEFNMRATSSPYLPLKFNGSGLAEVKLPMRKSKTFGLQIIDNYGTDDDALKIFRVGATKELAGTFVKNTEVMNTDGTYPSNNTYPTKYDLDIQMDGKRLTAAQISQIKWTVEGAGGYPTSYGASVLGVIDGKKSIEARKSGIVKITATLGDKKDSIYIVVPGDVTRSGVINSMDVTDIRFGATPAGLTIQDAFSLLQVDMDGNMVINSRDVTIARDMAAKKIEPSN